MSVPKREGGWGLLIAILVIIIIVLLFFNACQNARFPGGTPHSIQIHPPSTTLTPGTPATFEVVIVLNHPLPQIRKAFTVDIDEDDRWDDDLIHSVDVIYDPNVPSRPYAYGTFQLQCDNLEANGVFDLSDPNGGGDVSDDEAEHYVHAEGPGNNSPNVIVKCQPAPPPSDDDESDSENN